MCHRVLPQDQPEPATTLGIRLIGLPAPEPNSRQNFTSGHFIPITDLILDNSAENRGHARRRHLPVAVVFPPAHCGLWLDRFQF